VLVADEAHLIGVPGRGDAFEVGLTRFSLLNLQAPIIFLSATLPNVEQFAEWLTKLNMRRTAVVESKWRPVEIEDHFVECPSKEWEFNRYVLSQISRIRAKHRDQQILIFVHSIKKGRYIASMLGLPFHWSKLKLEERRKLEERFRKGEIRCMVSTSTLAYGVNLPADVGVIVGAHRGLSLVEPWDLRQMRGRIGRYGLSERGYVYWLLKRDYFDEVRLSVEELPAIRSVLASRLYFHLCSFVAREGMDRGEIERFLSRTFGWLTGAVDRDSVERAFELLERYKVLVGGKPTKLARASALMYVDPIDLAVLKKNLAGKPMTPKLIATAWASIPSFAYDAYIPDTLTIEINLPYSYQTLVANALLRWMRGDELEGVEGSVVRELVGDVERWIAALGIAGVDREYLKLLKVMLEQGVEKELVDLVQIPGVGRKRAKLLAKAGIKSRKEVVARRQLVENLLGKSVGRRVVAAAAAKVGKKSGKVRLVW